LPLAGALAAGLLAGGCGGGGSSEAAKTTAAPLRPIVSLRRSPHSKAAFVRRAVARCEAVRRRGVAEYERYMERNNLRFTRSDVVPHAAELFETVTAGIYERSVRDIRSLGAPQRDEQRLIAILNAIQHGIEAGRKDPASYFFGKSPFEPAYKLARPYGLGPCAKA
jgi:hypothetical protein